MTLNSVTLLNLLIKLIVLLWTHYYFLIKKYLFILEKEEEVGKMGGKGREKLIYCSTIHAFIGWFLYLPLVYQDSAPELPNRTIILVLNVYYYLLKMDLKLLTQKNEKPLHVDIFPNISSILIIWLPVPLSYSFVSCLYFNLTY